MERLAMDERKGHCGMSKAVFPGVKGGCGTVDKVAIMTESGKARLVFVGGKELHGVQRVNINYGVNTKPIVTVCFIADEVSLERIGENER